MEETTAQTFNIPIGRIQEVINHLTKLQARAAKAGQKDMFSYRIDSRVRVADYGVFVDGENGGYISTRYSYQELTITHNMIVHEGWMPIARVDIGARHISSLITYDKAIEQFGEDFLYNNHCDHCKRNQIIIQSYIMRKGTELMKVGKGCMKSMAPANAAAIASSFDIITLWSKYLADMTSPVDMDGDGSGGKWYGGGMGMDANVVYDKAQMLMALKYALEKTDGKWVTSDYGASGKICNRGERTFDRMDLNPRRFSYILDKDYISQINDAFATIISNEYCTSQLTDIELDDIKLFHESEKIRLIDMFLVKKVQRITAKLVKAESMKDSQYLGTVGDKMAFNVLLVETKNGIGQYGPWTMYIFRDDAGNMIKKFGTINSRFKFEDRFKFVAPIKGHEVHDGTKYTVLGGPFSKAK